MRRTRFLSVLIALLGAGLAVGVATASSRDRRFFSARYGVGLETPTGWSLSQHTGYPNILAVLLHPSGSRISVSVAPTLARDAQALAEENRRGLEAQHLTITRVAPGARGGVQIDARNTTRLDELRQVYLVRALGDGHQQALVLTLVTKPENLAAAAAAFDWVVAHVSFAPPAGMAETPDAGARSSAAQKTAGGDGG